MKAQSSVFRSPWRLAAFAIACFAVIWVLVLAWQINAFSSISSSETADAAVVLGAAVWKDRPSPVFEERIKHGIALYRSGDVKYLVFTGGVGEGDTITESEVGRDYAIERGIPPKQILVETNSGITYENLLEACRIMREANLRTALVVSDPLHMRRAMQIAEDIGLDADPSPTTTSRYQTWRSKSGLLAYEIFFYTLHTVNKLVGYVESCPV